MNRNFGDNAWAITSWDCVFGEDAIYCFKKKYVLSNPKKAYINITADARYKLKINGEVVSFGPYKGTGESHYYETVDISGWLKDGENIFEAEVLQLHTDKDIAHHRYLSSVPRTGNMIFILWGRAECEDGVTEFFTDETWLCAKNGNYEFRVPEYAWYGGMCEVFSDRKDLKWQPAKQFFPLKNVIVNGEVLIWQLEPSNMPKQRYDVTVLDTKDDAGNYDFGRLTSGFVRIKAKGNGRIRLTYAECYLFEEDGCEVKRDRADHRGIIKGDFDIIEVTNGECRYETFWFRTFRFIKAECDGETCIEELQVCETGYPLEVETDYDFGTDEDNKLWEICVNTLKNCMHETYEDCPYYEQFQYAMDTYMQMLFTMKISSDISLVKRAIKDFSNTVLVGDFSKAKYPAIMSQYIPGFSLYFIFMLDSLEKSRGEHAFIRKYLGTIDNIVCTFEELRGENGLVKKNNRWCFVDWADGWQMGVPESDEGDGLCVYSLMYADALVRAARLLKIFKRNCVAEEYEAIADEVKRVVKENCYDAELNLFADTDKKATFSQHGQIWAVLTELSTGDEAKELMEKSLKLKAVGGFAYAYHVFRAFEKVGEYELTKYLMAKYYKLLAENCTSVPETPDNPRSECHGWGAVAIYEFTSVILGVKDADGYVMVNPYMKGRKNAKGTVYTKYGKVFVEWKQGEDTYIDVKANENVNIKIVTSDGKIVEKTGNCRWIS